MQARADDDDGRGTRSRGTRRREDGNGKGDSDDDGGFSNKTGVQKSVGKRINFSKVNPWGGRQKKLMRLRHGPDRVVKIEIARENH